LVSSKLKKRFEGLVAAGIKPFADAGVTPNMVTILGLFVSLASAWCYYSWGSSPLLLPAAGTLVLVSGLFDAVDGVIARTTGKVTTFGGFFDSVSSSALLWLVIRVPVLRQLVWRWGVSVSQRERRE
jgi:phosphatidylglycerophosphate synthase